MGSSIQFRVSRWAAWTPACWKAEQWKEWARGNLQLKEAHHQPSVDMLPAMMRRRLSRLSRMTLQVVFEVLQDEPVDFLVFCSRHGELHRTVQILRDITEGEMPSPTAFSQSVHSTSAGLYSIIGKNKAATTTTSACGDSLEAALVIAWAKLVQPGVGGCLVVYADEVLPELFEPFSDPNDVSCSAAFLLAKAESPRPGFLVTLNQNSSVEYCPSKENSCLSLLRALLIPGSVEFETSSDLNRWRWKISHEQD